MGGAAVAWWLLRNEPPRNDAYAFVQVADAFRSPVYLTHAGDARLFVVEKAGRILILEGGQVRSVPFLDIEARVTSSGSEQGLLSLAFPPDYATSGLFYVYYNTGPAGDSVVARYRVSAADPNQADPASETRILEVPQPFPNHNGGLLKFGPDGYLYIGLGDGGSAGDPQNHGQDPATLLGTLLRLDVSDPSVPYRIPPDNPFVDDPTRAPEIWAYGLRNPWRFSFDRATGHLFIGDVGQGGWEEINHQVAGSPGGENYGWNLYEGDERFADRAAPPGAELVFPVATYAHGNLLDPRRAHCSVTGGYVYRGAALPELQGTYFTAIGVRARSGRWSALARAGRRGTSWILALT
ncbi:MAG: PQQ-dependent sugar dehydrogenase [Anaerolineae bacterium]|nr:PQQ-dependent sugar dehydrogenase [Anaerolineae bacterium]